MQHARAGYHTNKFQNIISSIKIGLESINGKYEIVSTVKPRCFDRILPKG